MELRLPLVFVEAAARNFRGWIPGFSGLGAEGLTLSELRDEVALKVMTTVEQSDPDEMWRYQVAPHLDLRHVQVDIMAVDRRRARRVPIQGRFAVLIEKWPGESFSVVTPTQLPEARFAVESKEGVRAALIERLKEYACEHGVQTMAPFTTSQRQQLDLLEVDVYPPTILPSKPRPPSPRPRRQPRTPEQERSRNRQRLQARELRAMAQNLTYEARDHLLGRAHGRDDLVRQLEEAFFGRDGAAVVLVGPSGAGKTAIVHELVRRLVAQESTTARRDVWRVDGNRFIAGMQYIGQWEARAKRVAAELADLGDILYVDDLVSLAFAGRTKGNMNVAQFLEPHLRRGELTVVAESTPERFSRLRDEAPGFASLFQVVQVPQMDTAATLPVMLGAVRQIEADAWAGGNEIAFTAESLLVVLQLAERFVSGGVFPGRGIRLLNELRGFFGAEGDKDDAERGALTTITENQVRTAFQQLSGLPDLVVQPDRELHEAEVRAALEAHVAGQPEALDVLVELVLAVKNALNDPKKPLASLLFVGPTGVGKTETAKALAHYLFGSKSRLVRFDMSELSHPADIARFVGEAGAPEGELTLALRSNPFSVVLFDEVEKAHPRIFDAMLQLLGEGRLTDASGRTVDARQTVILMTSNLGVREAASQVGYGRGGASEQRQHYVGAVEQFFRPEFFNRIDRVVAFRSLDGAALRRVVQHALNGLLDRRGLQQGNVLVDVDDELLDLLVTEASDPRYGARPLRRALERRVTVPLAHHLVQRPIEDWTFLDLFVQNGELSLSVSPLPWSPRWSAAARDALPATASALRGAHRELVERAQHLRAQQQELGSENTDVDLRWITDNVLERIENADVEPLDSLQFVEEQFLDRHPAFLRNDNAKHRRPVLAAIERPVEVDTGPAAQRLYPELAALREEMEIIEHQLAAMREGSRETWTVVLDWWTHATAQAGLHELVERLPSRNVAQIRFGDLPVDTLEQLAGKMASSDAIAPAIVEYQGYGIREILEPYVGLVLITNAPNPGDTVMAELAVLPGRADEAVAQWIAIRESDKAARRRGGVGAAASRAVRAHRIVWHLVVNFTGVSNVRHLGIDAVLDVGQSSLIAAWLRASTERQGDG